MSSCLKTAKTFIPEEIEEHLETIRLVAECAVIGRRPDDSESILITAIIYPDYEYAKSIGLDDKAAIDAKLKRRDNRAQ